MSPLYAARRARRDESCSGPESAFGSRVRSRLCLASHTILNVVLRTPGQAFASSSPSSQRRSVSAVTVPAALRATLRRECE